MHQAIVTPPTRRDSARGVTDRIVPLRPLALGLLALTLTLPPVQPAHAVPGGQLRVLVQGPWTCERPGDAAQRPTPLPEDNFRIAPDSSYYVGAASGNYLRLGDRLTMTSGPFAGRSYRVRSEATLRRLDARGAETGVRCVRAGAAGSNPSDGGDPGGDSNAD